MNAIDLLMLAMLGAALWAAFKLSFDDDDRTGPK
jgi:hypothetical protein